MDSGHSSEMGTPGPCMPHITAWQSAMTKEVHVVISLIVCAVARDRLALRRLLQQLPGRLPRQAVLTGTFFIFGWTGLQWFQVRERWLLVAVTT